MQQQPRNPRERSDSKMPKGEPNSVPNDPLHGRDDGDYRPQEPGHHDEFPTGGESRREPRKP